VNFFLTFYVLVCDNSWNIFKKSGDQKCMATPPLPTVLCEVTAARSNSNWHLGQPGWWRRERDWCVGAWGHGLRGSRVKLQNFSFSQLQQRISSVGWSSGRFFGWSPGRGGSVGRGSGLGDRDSVTSRTESCRHQATNLPQAAWRTIWHLALPCMLGG
jgi:hypothetical protein